MIQPCRNDITTPRPPRTPSRPATLALIAAVCTAFGPLGLIPHAHANVPNPNSQDPTTEPSLPGPNPTTDPAAYLAWLLEFLRRL